MGASRIVVHPGYVKGTSRQTAVEIAKATLYKALEEREGNGLSHITICPEVLGKSNQLGNLKEVMELCSLDENLIPCLDFAHLHSLTQGGMRTVNDFIRFSGLLRSFRLERMRKCHIHFSRLSSGKGGEKKHWTYADTKYGPTLISAEAIIALDIEPVIIAISWYYGRGCLDTKAYTQRYFIRQGAAR